MSVKITLLAKKAWTASFCCFCRKQVIPCFSNKLGRKFFYMDFLIYSTEDWLLEWPEQWDAYGITVDRKSLVFLKQHKEGCDGGWFPRYINLKKNYSGLNTMNGKDLFKQNNDDGIVATSYQQIWKEAVQRCGDFFW